MAYFKPFLIFTERKISVLYAMSRKLMTQSRRAIICSLKFRQNLPAFMQEIRTYWKRNIWQHGNLSVNIVFFIKCLKFQLSNFNFHISNSKAPNNPLNQPEIDNFKTFLLSSFRAPLLEERQERSSQVLFWVVTIYLF